MNSFSYSLSVFCLLGSFLFSDLYAQQIELKEKENGAVEIVSGFNQSESQHYLFRNKSMNVDEYWTVDPIRMWGHTQPWGDPQINFSPSGIYEAVGDLDGDGTTDFIKTYEAWDERTEDLSDEVMKTLVFMGSGDLTEPDHIIYDALFPIGDIAGTGQTQLVSQSDGVELYQFTGGSYTSAPVSIPEFENLGIPPSDFTVTRDDIDGNSTEDLIVNSGTTVHIGLIDTEIENSTVLSFDITSEIELQFFSVNSLDYVKWDDVPYVVTTGTNIVQGQTGTNYQQVLLVFELDITNETITLVQSSDFAYSFSSNMFLAEDDNGFPNLLVTGTEFDSDTTGGDFMKLYTMSGDTLLYNNEPVDLGDMDGFPVGDLNGNGWSDFVVNSNDEYSFAVLNPADTTLTIEGIIGGLGGEDDAITFDRGFRNQGDLNDDGFDDLQYYGWNNSSFGQLRISGGNSSGTVDYANPAQYLHSLNDYLITQIEGTYTFGDITGNGLDEYGLAWSDETGRRLEIYEGGSDGTSAIGSIEPGGTMEFITSGDFHTDGRVDILMLVGILAEVDGVTQQFNELHFYEQGEQEPYHIITGEDYYPGQEDYHNFIGTIANAGDINDDGLDDVLVATQLNGLIPVGVYYGGSSISLSPDAQISFPEANGLSYGFGWGGTLQGGFDFNGDGIDDFLIGNNNEFNTNDRPEGASFSNDGAVHIFYGTAGTNDFSSGADITIKSDTTAYDNNIWYWLFGFNEVAYGDFNGDGSTDLAIKPFRHMEFNDITTGKPSIHIYHGGEDFDGQPDQILPLLEEIHQPDLLGIGSDTTYFSGRAEMAGVPDINGDGADEFLYIGSASSRNGSLFFGGDTLSVTPDAVLKAPNQSLPFNSNGNFINRQYRMSIGEMTTEGVTSVLVWQQLDRNFRDTPAYMYELSQMAVSIDEPVASNTPQTFSLKQNYPNPFNPTTNIQFDIPQASDVTLKVYNILGQEVMTVLNDFKQAGTHTATFDASNLASGIYIYQLQAGKVNLQRKMTLIK